MEELQDQGIYATRIPVGLANFFTVLAVVVFALAAVKIMWRGVHLQDLGNGVKMGKVRCERHDHAGTRVCGLLVFVGVRKCPCCRIL
jgi:hypothetical protein